MNPAGRRQIVCARCGFAGPPASDGLCQQCGGELAGSAGAGGTVGKKSSQGDKDSDRAQLQDTHGEELMNCRNQECQAALVEEQEFCTECGTSRDGSVSEAFTCSFCSLELQELTEAVSNCPRCGTSAGGPAQVIEAVSGTLDESVAYEDDQDDDDKGDSNKDGRPDGDDKGSKKEVKCPACGASVNLESKKEGAEDDHCGDCGYSFREKESREEAQAEEIISALVQSEDADQDAKDIANEIIWG